MAALSEGLKKNTCHSKVSASVTGFYRTNYTKLAEPLQENE